MIKTQRRDSYVRTIKSKIIIGFILFILGITYVEAMNVKKMEENTKKA